MASRTTSRSARGSQPIRGRGQASALSLGPLGNDLLGVVLAVLAVAMGVSLVFPSSAPVSHAVGQTLILLFGAGAPLCPLAILIFALSFFGSGQRSFPARTAAGLALLTCSVLAMLSILVPGAETTPDVVVDPAVLATRGGYIGGGISWGLLELVGREVGMVLLVGMAIGGIIICGFSVSNALMAARRGAAQARENLSEAHSRVLERRAERYRQPTFGNGGYPYGDFDNQNEDEPAESEPVSQTTYLGSRTKSVLTRKDTHAPATNDLVNDDWPYDQELEDEEWGYDEGVPTGFVGRLRSLLGFDRPAYEDDLDEFYDDYDEFDDDSYATADEAYAVEQEDPYAQRTTHGSDGARKAVRRPAATTSQPKAAATPSAQGPSRRAAQTLAAATQEVANNPIGESVPSFLVNAASRKTSIQDRPTQTTMCSAPARTVDRDHVDSPQETDATPVEQQPREVTKTLRRQPAVASKPKARNSSKKRARANTAVKESARPGDADETYTLPPFSMLASNPHSAQSASSDAELEATMQHLQSTLSEFGLTSRVVDYVAGPLVTTFQIEMGEGERVNRITNLEDDIALTLAAESVRIFAPIPGTSRVGIEIPNKTRQNVYLRDVLAGASGGPLEFALGRDAEGRPVTADLASMPHLLVAGATGSGKSVMINSLIMSLLMRDTPKQVRLILVDPKRVEFSGYNGLPHLYAPVVTEPRQAASALQWAVGEMERRLKVFERAGARNINIYNEMCVSGKLSEMDNPPEPMPFMVIIIDELSDLMMVAGKDVEASIVRIAQLARAAGIHLVLATQRPSANVVTGLIKSNIETRIALSVASGTDSRVIIDQVGAQRLLGNGDMLFKARGNRTRRVLGCFVSDPEIETIVEFIRDQGEPDYHEEILQASPVSSSGQGTSVDDLDEDDPLVWEAAQIVVESQLGSTSGLQRRLKVGYARAGRIMDNLEAKGVVGPAMGSKPREVLLDEEGLEELRVQEERYRGV